MLIFSRPGWVGLWAGLSDGCRHVRPLTRPALRHSWWGYRGCVIVFSVMFAVRAAVTTWARWLVGMGCAPGRGPVSCSGHTV